MIDLDIISLFLPACAAGILVLSTHFLLGRQVLKRGIVFMDLAIAQIAAMGAIVATQFSGVIDGGYGSHHHAHEYHEHGMTELYLMMDWSLLLNMLMPFAFSLGAAGLIAFLARFIEKELEAVIGCLYVLAASAITLMLANNPHGAEHILKTLGGHILWLTWADLIWACLVSVLFLLVVMFRPAVLSGAFFYPLFAVMITLSVQLVGIYLVFSMLIMPAIAVAALRGWKAIAGGYLVGTLAVFSGLIIAHHYDLPGGAAIVVTMAVVGMVFRWVDFLRKGCV
ncbi:metal ABC transporter permease [Parendozoicomonas haliclonae]|uniref:ABC 3 transport family protein n=1 Tax=Parendozoicomonas haliclonae TaxID=1960125 RepID=A0A1X7AIR0_9GAMM|nr:metal ABC transporter permease [Parendozoicomonas haliclonae]SMA39378.1 ABC 3 transport family protein [Parendozoicomonas haliclonae]